MEVKEGKGDFEGTRVEVKEALRVRGWRGTRVEVKEALRAHLEP